MSGNSIRYRCSLSDVWVCAASFIKSGRFQTTYSQYGSSEYKVLRKKIAVHIRDHRNPATHDTYLPLSLIGYALNSNIAYRATPQRGVAPINRAGGNKLRVSSTRILPWMKDLRAKRPREASAFKQALIKNEVNGGVRADILITIIAEETWKTYDPSKQNASTKATGLIQIKPDLAKSLGTTTDRLKHMSMVEQLVYVNKYFSYKLRGRKRLQDLSLEDAYVLVFCPAHLGKPRNWQQVIYSGVVALRNPGIDSNKDSKIYMNEVHNYIKTYYNLGLKYRGR